MITCPIFKITAIIFALCATMITGFLQFSIGVKMLVDTPHDKNLQLYVGGVILFFLLLLINHLINYNDFLSYTLLPIPFLLAIYISTIIYKKPKQ
jgi:choline-glycine betaine transporter